jgi:hypothetical protein
MDVREPIRRLKVERKPCDRGVASLEEPSLLRPMLSTPSDALLNQQNWQAVGDLHASAMLPKGGGATRGIGNKPFGEPGNGTWLSELFRYRAQPGTLWFHFDAQPPL